MFAEKCIYHVLMESTVISLVLEGFSWCPLSLKSVMTAFPLSLSARKMLAVAVIRSKVHCTLDNLV